MDHSCQPSTTLHLASCRAKSCQQARDSFPSHSFSSSSSSSCLEMTATVGYVFHPTDEQLINYFLKKKVLGHDSEVDHIAEVDLYKCEPWDLPQLSVLKSDEPMWFFFCRLDYKYSNGRRPIRTTRAGYWKVTGKDGKVWSKKGTKQEIGIKKTLVFCIGRAPSGFRTNWVIHEYHLTAPDFPNENAYVICRLKKIEDTEADGVESSRHVPLDYGNISEDNPLLLSNLESLVDNVLLDNDFPSALQSQRHLEQGQNLLLTNSFRNDLKRLQYYVGSSEHGNEDYMNSVIVDPFEELKTVYVEDSSDTEAKSFHSQFGVVGTSSLFNGQISSKDYQQMQMVQSSSGILPSSRRDSSVNSLTNIPQIPTHKSQYPPRSDKRVAEGDVPTIWELQDDFSRKVVITDKVGESAKHGTALDMLMLQCRIPKT